MTVILSLFLSFGAPRAHAQSADYGLEISRKLGRGLWNMVSSPAEIPCGVRDDYAERKGAGIATGFFKGTLFFLRRLLVGSTEVMTFVIPMEATIPPVCAKGPEAQVQS